MSPQATPLLACLADQAVYRLQEQGRFRCKPIGRRQTPFGVSEAIFLSEDAETPYYLLAQHGAGGYQVSGSFINYRANLYALKDLGVRGIICFTAAAAVSHNHSVGDLILVSDLIDRTTRRPGTFFENAGFGSLRQFPVFCPAMRKAMADCLREMGCQFRDDSTLVVTEGPRLETPAEVRSLAATGGELVGHHLAPEAFLAKELELCLAGVAFVTNYAETGSQFRPFSANDLFGGLASPDNEERVIQALNHIADLVPKVSAYAARQGRSCECDKTMRYTVQKFGLPTDWHEWFAPMPTGEVGVYEKTPADPASRMGWTGRTRLEKP
jgi:5'-methylthioadenosine phosphorylase